jgi:hypothetical protein
MKPDAKLRRAHAAFRGRIGLAREDITPPVGIYARNWGAAAHDAAEGIHRPLTLTALTLQMNAGDRPLVLLDTDLGWWTYMPMCSEFLDRLRAALGLEESQLIFALSHTHSAPPLAPREPDWKGGELLPAYVEKVFDASVRAAKRALGSATDATLDWHAGKCQLASNRDLRDPSPDRNRFICGYNPDAQADDTLVIGRVANGDGKLLAVIVNYACHPTTLAWQNKLISPDYLGAMRETIESQFPGALALFLQGASGEMSPRSQYVGDRAVADRHGRQLGHAALATLADMEPPGQELVFERAVESGAPLAAWTHRPHAAARTLRAAVCTVELPLREWPSAAQLEREFAACTDRALAERLRRKRQLRRALGDGATYPLPVWVWQIGDAVVAGCMLEAYSALQQELRRRFPQKTIAYMNLVNGSIGYAPPAELYGEDIYQVWQTPFERGCMEQLLETVANEIARLI